MPTHSSEAHHRASFPGRHTESRLAKKEGKGAEQYSVPPEDRDC